MHVARLKACFAGGELYLDTDEFTHMTCPPVRRVRVFFQAEGETAQQTLYVSCVAININRVLA